MEEHINNIMESVNLKEAEVKALNRRGITSREQLRRLFPYKYVDYSKLTNISKDCSGEFVAFKGKLIKWCRKQVSAHDYMITATVVSNGLYVNLAWFHNAWLGKVLSTLMNEQVLVCGKIVYNEQYKNFSIVNAEVSAFSEDNLHIETIYSSIKGVKEESLRKEIDECLKDEEEEYIPSYIKECYGNIPSLSESIYKLHHPQKMSDIEMSEARMLFDDMLYFATKIEEDNCFSKKGTLFQAGVRRMMDKYIESLPYTLTNAQRSTIEKLYELIKDARKVDALVQGDVGCGKTTVAIAMLILMAENGYQSVLMTPTVALGNQHYEEIKEVCERLGFTVAFYGGDLKVKEKNDLKKKIKDGSIDIIVGTQGVASLDFKNLSMVIADEEHKYGVEQREKLANDGVHMITMSATPIPRSIATTIYGEGKEVFTINELPSNRLPVKTICLTDEKAICNGIYAELKKGHQIYIVCPLVKDSDSEKMANVKSVEEIFTYYQNVFGKEYKVEVVNGKMDKSDVEEAMSRFKKNESQILVATSVIEVGISVPNASAIVIYNAERFGIAELHQLRGRVGRGSIQSFCILNTQNVNNARISKMCETTDGFEIAKADLEQRGMGDILGSEQSGHNTFIEQALKYPKRFKIVKGLAKKMVAHCDYKDFLKEYERRNGIE